MIPGYAYVAMLVTGCLHCLLGVASVIISFVGLGVGPYIRNYFVGSLFVGIWVCLVGSLGIAAGIQKLADEKIRQLKIAYMVTAILSACIFCAIAWWMYAVSVTFNVWYIVVTNTYRDDYYNIGCAGLIIVSLEFILAIVSSSICCCCSPTTASTTVIVQAPPQQVVTTVPGQSTIQYQLPPNTTIQYQPPGDGTVAYQPPAYQQYPTKPQ